MVAHLPPRARLADVRHILEMCRRRGTQTALCEWRIVNITLGSRDQTRIDKLEIARDANEDVGRDRANAIPHIECYQSHSFAECSVAKDQDGLPSALGASIVHVVGVIQCKSAECAPRIVDGCTSVLFMSSGLLCFSEENKETQKLQNLICEHPGIVPPQFLESAVNCSRAKW